MKENILIVEDEFIVANDLKIKLINAGYSVCGIAASVAEAEEMIGIRKPSWVFLDIFLRNGSIGTDLAPKLASKGIGYIYISANSNQSVLEKVKATHPYGFLVKPFQERELLIMLEIASQRHQYNLQLQTQREQLSKMQLLSLANIQNRADLIQKIPVIFQSFIPFDLLRIVLPTENETDQLAFSRIGYEEYQPFSRKEILNLKGIDKTTLAINKCNLLTQDTFTLLNGEPYVQLQRNDNCERALSTSFQLSARLSIPVTTKGKVLASFIFYSKVENTYTYNHQIFFDSILPCLSTLVQNLQRDSYSNSRKPQLSEKTAPTSKTFQNPQKFDGIIGNSRLLLKVLDDLNIVAGFSTSVLITGESGTGKERIAQCIHKMSNRSNKPIVVVNCAALPAELIESELFGHEKGSFTGAADKRIGKFEQADGGTVFLDEIGELSMNAQVKLLRVLQERAFERVGGAETIQVDIRIIAATNRNLEKEVAQGRFRLDLYYRLNVFPIEVPPLRDRKEDIPLLAKSFVQKFCDQTDQPIIDMSDNALAQLKRHNWPGNIRELEHVIERHTLMAKGSTIREFHLAQSTEPLLPPQTGGPNDQFQELKTLETMEMEYILHVLDSCNGRIAGTRGAAEILGMPTSTLRSKMKKLGINKNFSFDK